MRRNIIRLCDGFILNTIYTHTCLLVFAVEQKLFLLFIISIAAVEFFESNKRNKSSQFLQIWQVKAIFKDLHFACPKSKTIIRFTFSLAPFIFFLFHLLFNYLLQRCQTAVDWCDWINLMIYIQTSTET